MGTVMSGWRDGDGDTAGALLAELARLEAERDRLNAEVEMYKRQLMAQADLTQLLEGRPAADGTGPIARVQGPRAAGHRAPRDRHLRVVKVIVFIAGLSGLGFKGWRAGAARAALAALTLGPVAHVAVSAAHPPYAAVQAQAAIPGWHTKGTPIVQVPARAAAFTRPRLDAKAAAGSPPAAVVPWYLSPQSSPASPPASPQPSVPSSSPSPAGPATLQVPVTGIDLSSGTPQQVTLTATGGGWVSWSVSTAGTDLDFSPSHGVLQGGQSVTVTVSLAAAQVQDGNAQQVFSVGGSQVTVTLPAPPPPVVDPSAVATAVPTAAPSPASS